MKRTLGIATVLCMIFGSAAYADHGRGRGRGHGGPVVRDHRDHGPPRGPAVRDHRHGGARVAHVRMSGGRYVFPGGVVRVYKQPRHRRYYDHHVRPPIIVESYDPVPGYMWVSGSWQWGGGEWIWQPGYWAVAEAPAPQPVIRGGISVSGGISIH